MRPVREASLARPPGTGGGLGSRRAPEELCLKLTDLGYKQMNFVVIQSNCDRICGVVILDKLSVC